MIMLEFLADVQEVNGLDWKVKVETKDCKLNQMPYESNQSHTAVDVAERAVAPSFVHNVLGAGVFQYQAAAQELKCRRNTK